MNLECVVARNKTPEPWAEGDNIPWSDPGFSRRMLKEHLSQAHDAASRRLEIIDRQVEWIHRELLSGQPSRILDLGCGPGLYAQRLATHGHKCTGIDYSPASIAHAERCAGERHLAIDYLNEDIRRADFPPGQDLVMLISGELNVFSTPDARRILTRAADCLTKSGQVILEVHASGVLEKLGKEPRTWHSWEAGLWSSSPHICLQENFWYRDRKTAITRYIVMDAATGEAAMYSASYQDYSGDEYEALLMKSGFGAVTRCPSLTGLKDDDQEVFTVFVARKSG